MRLPTISSQDNPRQFVSHTGIAAPFLLPNVDTDLIIPLNPRPGTAGMTSGQRVFESIRYTSEGAENPNFILNQEPFRNASILLGAENFGTGSSRESAVTGLRAFGLRSIIAPSFGQIFYNNCFANGMLPVVLDEERIRVMADLVEADPEVTFTVSLEENVIRRSGMEDIDFSVDERLRNKLLNGLADQDEILLYQADAEAFERVDRGRRPWIYDWQ
jgi:3-isopropylmalate/(R)-2-methylmalate dehydratase small subunit